MPFSILMNGVGDAFSKKHYGTHFLLQKNDFLLAVDCPDAYRRALAEHGFQHQKQCPYKSSFAKVSTQLFI